MREDGMEKLRSARENQRYVVETITMTTVTERRVVREASDSTSSVAAIVASLQPQISAVASVPPAAIVPEPECAVETPSQDDNGSLQSDDKEYSNLNTALSGILKGGKLWKSEQTQVCSMNSYADIKFKLIFLFAFSVMTPRILRPMTKRPNDRYALLKALKKSLSIIRYKTVTLAMAKISKNNAKTQHVMRQRLCH